jgi:DNA-3-methyladenine glycosylase II
MTTSRRSATGKALASQTAKTKSVRFRSLGSTKKPRPSGGGFSERSCKAQAFSAPPLIDCEAALDLGLSALCGLDPETIVPLLKRTGRPPLRRREPGFEGLAWIVISQQVSTASANAIFARVQARILPFDAATLCAASDEDLRVCGLSAPKIRTLRALSAHLQCGNLDLMDLASLSAETAHAALIAVKGIGPWTADIFLLFCLGHPDVWPVGDLALQEAARIALQLDNRPDQKAMMAIGERWRPWRAVAARLLWAFYRVARADGMVKVTQ